MCAYIHSCTHIYCLNWEFGVFLHQRPLAHKAELEVLLLISAPHITFLCYSGKDPTSWAGSVSLSLTHLTLERA